MKRIKRNMLKDYNEMDSDNEDGQLQDLGSDYEEDVKKKRAKLGIFDDSDSDIDFGESSKSAIENKSIEFQPSKKPPLPLKPSLNAVKKKLESKQMPSISSFFKKINTEKGEGHKSTN